MLGLFSVSLWRGEGELQTLCFVLRLGPRLISNDRAYQLFVGLVGQM